MATINLTPPCRNPRCRNRADGRGGFCSVHQSEFIPTARNEKKAKVYNSNRWKKLSKSILKKYPLCVRCEALGKIKNAVLVDHLAGFTGADDFKAWDELYLFPLCTPCHGVVTGLEKRLNFSEMERKKAVFLKYEGYTDKPILEINI